MRCVLLGRCLGFWFSGLGSWGLSASAATAAECLVLPGRLCVVREVVNEMSPDKTRHWYRYWLHRYSEGTHLAADDKKPASSMPRQLAQFQFQFQFNVRPSPLQPQPQPSQPKPAQAPNPELNLQWSSVLALFCLVPFPIFHFPSLALNPPPPAPPITSALQAREGQSQHAPPRRTTS